MTNPLSRGPITTAFGLAIIAMLYYNLVIESKELQPVHACFGILAVILIGVKDDVLSVIVFWRDGQRTAPAKGKEDVAPPGERKGL